MVPAVVAGEALEVRGIHFAREHPVELVVREIDLFDGLDTEERGWEGGRAKGG